MPIMSQKGKGSGPIPRGARAEAPLHRHGDDGLGLENKEKMMGKRRGSGVPKHLWFLVPSDADRLVRCSCVAVDVFCASRRRVAAAASMIRVPRCMVGRISSVTFT